MTATRSGGIPTGQMPGAPLPGGRRQAAFQARPQARAQAPARTRPETAPRTQPARRTPLRVVGQPDTGLRGRRRRRLVVGALVGLACAGLFAIVGVRVLLAQGQLPVDRLEAEVTDAQAQSQRLRLDVARLESPTRIVAEAQGRLGMVPPATVTFLTPLPETAAAPDSDGGPERVITATPITPAAG